MLQGPWNGGTRAGTHLEATTGIDPVLSPLRLLLGQVKFGGCDFRARKANARAQPSQRGWRGAYSGSPAARTASSRDSNSRTRTTRPSGPVSHS